jgi:hypothetical protein
VELTLALMVVAIASFPARAWGHLKIGFDFLIEKFKEWGRNLGETMSENKGLILGIVGLLVLGIVLSFAGLPASVGAAIAGLVTTVVGVFSNVGVAVAAEVDETKRATLTKWQEIKQGIVDKWEELKKNAGQKWSEIRTSVETHVQGTTSWVGERWQGTRTTLASIWDGLNVTARNKWNAVKTTIKDVINSIIELINKFIRFWNSMRLNVPEVDIPLLGKRGGFSVGLPKVPEIPRLRRGGIIPEDMIVRAGERSPEAIVPLTGEDARPFARVIANELAAVISGGGSESSLPPMYVGTLVADERGLRELYRKFKVIDLSEKTRRG